MSAVIKFLFQLLESGADVVITFAENNPTSTTLVVMGILALVTKYVLAFIE